MFFPDFLFAEPKLWNICQYYEIFAYIFPNTCELIWFGH